MFSGLSVAKQDTLFRASSNSNFRIVIDSKTEARSESNDRVWRRWESYCDEYLGRPDPSLVGLSPEDTEFACRTFIELYRGSNFSVTGSITGQRKVPMAGLTVREAISTLGATMRHDFGAHPFHTETGSNQEYKINVQEHLTAINSVSPSRKYQKAITPEFLRCMSDHASWVLLNDSEDHTTDLLISAFFFAMRSPCTNCWQDGEH